MKYLNLGCGDRFHPSWTNINFVSTGEGVIARDLKQGISFPDNSFDVVYHSHVLEHFSKAEAEPFIRECYRVLRPQGILRVVVPDLEQIAKMYLYSLEKASNGSEKWEQNYQWMLLEMYDQTVRNKTGGDMLKFLTKLDLANQEFVVKRCGIEVQNLIAAAGKINSSPDSEKLIIKLIKSLYRIFRYRNYRRQAILKLILSPQELDALRIGQFRQSGEIHQWMYDHYSLSVLLKNCGLQGITRRTAHESCINNWTSFNLDTEADGSIYKPDSLYIEAIKLVP
ncbi:MAG: methyltransferase domain-containing protein [Pseudanabaena sp. M046S1SP1A06QC]|nr:methyltransferase domain-containing protein [Pseudanabaena sp. M046S1SP1A06QC]